MIFQLCQLFAQVKVVGEIKRRLGRQLAMRLTKEVTVLCLKLKENWRVQPLRKSEMDKDPFFVSKNLYCVLHGCNAKTTPLGDIWRLFGKWDYDCADFTGPCFIYNGDPETTPATMAEQIHRSIPQVLARKDENTNQVKFSVRAVDHYWARAHDHHDGGGQYHPGSHFRENRSSDFSFLD